MAKFLLIRHGEADYSYCKARGFMGHGNDLAQLSKKGIEQIKETANDPRLVDADLIISSPYTRALQSAAIIATRLGTDIQVEVDVHEWLPDKSFKFKTFEEVVELTNDFLSNKGVYPSGETKLWEDAKSVEARFKNVLEKYKHMKKVVIVCHGFAMMIATERKIGFEDSESILNGEIVELTYD